MLPHEASGKWGTYIIHFCFKFYEMWVSRICQYMSLFAIFTRKTGVRVKKLYDLQWWDKFCDQWLNVFGRIKTWTSYEIRATNGIIPCELFDQLYSLCNMEYERYFASICKKWIFFIHASVDLSQDHLFLNLHFLQDGSLTVFNNFAAIMTWMLQMMKSQL